MPKNFQNEISIDEKFKIITESASLNHTEKLHFERILDRLLKKIERKGQRKIREEKKRLRRKVREEKQKLRKIQKEKIKRKLGNPRICEKCGALKEKGHYIRWIWFEGAFSSLCSECVFFMHTAKLNHNANNNNHPERE